MAHFPAMPRIEEEWLGGQVLAMVIGRFAVPIVTG